LEKAARREGAICLKEGKPLKAEVRPLASERGRRGSAKKGSRKKAFRFPPWGALGRDGCNPPTGLDAKRGTNRKKPPLPYPVRRRKSG